MKITGVAIPFGRLSENLGGFVERFEPGSVARALRADADIRFLHSHDPARLLGRTTSRTLRLFRSPEGLGFELLLPDSHDGSAIYELVRRGDSSGVSFGFSVPEGGESWDFSGPMPVRTIHDARISELSTVAWPAYRSTTVSTAERGVSARDAPTGNRIEWLRRWQRTKLAR